MTYLMKGSSTTNVSGSDGGSTAEGGGGNFVEEDVTEVDLFTKEWIRWRREINCEKPYVCSSNKSICNDVSITNIVLISATQSEERNH